MNETKKIRIVTLKDLWDLLVRRIVVMVLAAVIAAGAFFVVDMATYDPQYSSTATLYILRQNGSGDTSSGEAANELSLALRLVYDCNYFLKSRTVLNTVIEDLGLDMTYKQLYSRITTTNPSNTRVLEITVQGDTPEQAKAIVDRICDIGPSKIEEAMGFSQVNLYEYGTLPEGPSNSPNILSCGVVGIVAAVLVYAAYFLVFLLDDRIRTNEDIERELGLSVLAEIPDLNGSSRSPYAYYRGSKKTTMKKRP
ncbi:MAG: hypothetical protein IJ375_00935 [Oscillospiraceae bacterium]|nr:hypothetical protein [Oscillospiraceae bacterium]